MKTRSPINGLAPPEEAGGSLATAALDFDGEKYRLASAHQKEWGARLIEDLKLKGSERILDLGCGDGALTAELARRVPHGFVLGIDSSPSMIAAASQWAGPNLKFERRDITEIVYRGEFDLLFSNSALHWIKDHSRLLPRLRTALRAGGTMRFNFPAAGNCPTFNRTIRHLMALPKYAPGFQSFDWPWYMPGPDDYRRVVSRFSWQELRVAGEVADRFFPDVEALTRWIDQPCLVPFLPRVGSSEREAFRAEVVARMIRATRRPDGRCFERFRRIQLFCRQ